MRSYKIIGRATAEKMLSRKLFSLGPQYTEEYSGFLFQVVRCKKTNESFQYLYKK